jgi:spermidine synthase
MKLSRETRYVLVAFLLSGAAALVYEVAWTRALSLVLGSTVYALSTMLSTFMAGLALGAYLGGKLSDRGVNLLFFFGLCELLIGATGMLSVPVIYKLPYVYLQIYRNFHVYPGVFFVIQIALCAAMIAASFNLAIGIAMVVLSRQGNRRALMLLIPLYLLAFGTLATASPGGSLMNFYSAFRIADPSQERVYLTPGEVGITKIFDKEYAEGTVRAYRSSATGALLLHVGGKLEGSSPQDIHHTRLLAYLPIAVHPGPRSFLNIGLGAGLTAMAAQRHVDMVEVVELNPGVVEAVRLHSPSEAFDGIAFFVHDGRNYLMRTEETYDIIASGASYPTEPGASSLFTREFYELAASRLNPGGLFSQSVPYYLLSNNDVTMLLKTMGSVFPHVYVWKTPLTIDLVIVASAESFAMSADEIRQAVQRLNRPSHPLKFQLSRTPEEVAGVIGNSAIPINTDDHPRLEFSAVDNLLRGNLTDKASLGTR